MAVAWAKCDADSAARKICATCVLVGTAACIAAFSLVHPQGPYFLARVQLLRSFQVIYVLGVVLLALLYEFSTGGGTSDARFIKDHCPVAEIGLPGTTMHKVDECMPLSEIEKLTSIYAAILSAYFAAPPA